MEAGAGAAVTPGGAAPDVAARAAGPEGSAGAPGGLAADTPARADAPALAAEPDGAERPVAPVLDAAARESLVAEAAGKSTRQVKEMLAKVDPDLGAAGGPDAAAGSGAVGAQGGDR